MSEQIPGPAGSGGKLQCQAPADWWRHVGQTHKSWEIKVNLRKLVAWCWGVAADNLWTGSLLYVQGSLWLDQISLFRYSFCSNSFKTQIWPTVTQVSAIHPHIWDSGFAVESGTCDNRCSINKYFSIATQVPWIINTFALPRADVKGSLSWWWRPRSHTVSSSPLNNSVWADAGSAGEYPHSREACGWKELLLYILLRGRY